MAALFFPYFPIKKALLSIIIYIHMYCMYACSLSLVYLTILTITTIFSYLHTYIHTYKHMCEGVFYNELKLETEIR